jgi:hypothetical protein
MNCKGCGRKQSCLNLRYHPSICLNGVRKIMKNLNQKYYHISQVDGWLTCFYCYHSLLANAATLELVTTASSHNHHTGSLGFHLKQINLCHWTSIIKWETNQPASAQIHFLRNSSLFVKMLHTEQEDCEELTMPTSLQLLQFIQQETLLQKVNLIYKHKAKFGLDWPWGTVHGKWTYKGMKCQII